MTPTECPPSRLPRLPLGACDLFRVKEDRRDPLTCIYALTCGFAKWHACHFTPFPPLPTWVCTTLAPSTGLLLALFGDANNPLQQLVVTLLEPSQGGLGHLKLALADGQPAGVTERGVISFPRHTVDLRALQEDRAILRSLLGESAGSFPRANRVRVNSKQRSSFTSSDLPRP